MANPETKREGGSHEINMVWRVYNLGNLIELPGCGDSSKSSASLQANFEAGGSRPGLGPGF